MDESNKKGKRALYRQIYPANEITVSTVDTEEEVTTTKQNALSADDKSVNEKLTQQPSIAVPAAKDAECLAGSERTGRKLAAKIDKVSKADAAYEFLAQFDTNSTEKEPIMKNYTTTLRSKISSKATSDMLPSPPRRSSRECPNSVMEPASVFRTDPTMETFFEEGKHDKNDSSDCSGVVNDPMQADDIAEIPDVSAGAKEEIERKERDRKRKKSTKKRRIKRQLESYVRRLNEKWTPELCQQLFDEEDLIELCYRAYASLMCDSPLVDVPAPVNVCGDIHGQFKDLRMILREIGYPPEQRYVFLGDYVDRGPFSLEVLILLFSLRLLYPKSVTLLRGNHEDGDVNMEYGFFREVKMRYSIALYDIIQSVFRVMPFGALVEGRILCVHGGISEDITSLDQQCPYKPSFQIRRINRPCRIPEIGITCDLTWSDPSPTAVGFQKNPRGASKVFGPDAALAFCEKVGVDYIVRAHQVPLKGYEILPGNRVVTIFSAVRYCNAMENNGAVLHIRRVYQQTLMFSLTVFTSPMPLKTPLTLKKSANVTTAAPRPSTKSADKIERKSSNK